MSYDYHGIQLIDPIFFNHSRFMPRQLQNLTQAESHGLETFLSYRKGRYTINAVEYLHPMFLVSEDAKKYLFYPQTFLIMDAKEGYFTEREDFDSFEIRFTLEGEGFLEYEGKKYTLKPGEGYMIDCKKHHYYGTNGARWCSTIFHLNGIAVQNLFNHYSSDNNVKFSKLSCPNFEMLQLQVLRTANQNRPFYEQRISCNIDLLLTELLLSRTSYLNSSAENSAKGNVIAEIIDYLRDHYYEDITIDLLTKKYAINRTQLCLDFKAYTGFSIKQYLIAIRINLGKTMLLNTSCSVEQISEMIGFHSTVRFIEHLKKTEGITPLQYRKQG